MEPMKPMKPLEPMKPMKGTQAWWPSELGPPDSSGGQNDLQYAYFADAGRLAVRQGGAISVYDTADHRITGVAQQQGSGDRDGPTFTSQHGEVSLHDLKKVDR